MNTEEKRHHRGNKDEIWGPTVRLNHSKVKGKYSKRSTDVLSSSWLSDRDVRALRYGT